ncbi:MAG: M13 family metallopeptidase [Candidatus Eisenbacteria bacterium]|uniref:M13 family metallopeptidase n=1 Tax=Eiseniibacteriota bacterium TaxID=2212470 RepID=A0A538TRR2_UNCEI|nr:MAG: M13 family metallopeptidase [Candidatus Eisenbacteria bacterium]
MNVLKISAAVLCAIALAVTASAAPRVQPWGLHLDYLDQAAKPGDDFYVYANGGWLKTAEIPPDRPGAGVGLEMSKANEERLKAIIDELHTRANLTAEEQKLRDLYDAFMDEGQVEANGLKPAEKDLAEIASLRTLDDVAREMALPSLRLGGPFEMFIAADDKHPDAYIVKLGQSGLGLPDRDYYLRDDKEIVSTREAYKKHLAQSLNSVAAEDAEARAAAVYELEHQIAVVSWAAADRRDAEKVYNPMTIPKLRKLAPGYPWDTFFKWAGISPKSHGVDRTVVVGESTAFPRIAKIFADTPVPVWRDFLTIRYVHTFAPYLPRRFNDADFAFYGTVLQGRARQLDRPTRGARLLDNRVGEALGKLYVGKYFPAESKAKVRALVDNLLQAYEQDLKTLPWMTPETRQKALEKLHQFTVKVGYPDHWRDYSTLQIRRDDLVGDVKNAIAFEWNRNLKRIDDPVDKTEWGMTPPTVNAYYNETVNEIVFPAGILQAPDFDPAADDAVNYGGIGAVIGHEISHGFDDQGSKYDGMGVMRQWWVDADRKNFDERTTALANQYDQYEPLSGIHINGRLTLGENIADLAGLVIAHKAYRISLGGKDAPVLDGLTGDQRFYLAFAQGWRSKVRDETTRQRLLSNPHSPPPYRVNGVVRNDDGWYEAFPNVTPQDKFYLAPEQRVRLW